MEKKHLWDTEKQDSALHSLGSKYELTTDCCESGNKPPVFTKYGVFFDRPCNL